MYLSETERMEILIMRGYGDRKRTYAEVVGIFNNDHPDRNISKSTVHRTVQRFINAGRTKSMDKPGRPKVATNDDNKLNVLLALEENPHVSTTQLALRNGISQKSVLDILNSEKLKPYKCHLTQELLADDPDRRMEFCQTVMEMINDTPEFLNNILFTDEATFCFNGEVNRHNSRYWSRENPHWMREIHTQRQQKVNVWAGIIGDRLIGPFFIEGNLDGAAYLNLLTTQVKYPTLLTYKNLLIFMNIILTIPKS